MEEACSLVGAPSPGRFGNHFICGRPRVLIFLGISHPLTVRCIAFLVSALPTAAVWFSWLCRGLTFVQPHDPDTRFAAMALKVSKPALEEWPAVIRVDSPSHDAGPLREAALPT